MAVTPGGVVVQGATEIGPFNQTRQRALLGQLKFTVVLSHLRLDISQIQLCKNLFLGLARHEHAGFLRLGASVARKGWLSKADVINTLPLPALMKALKKKRES